MEYIYAVMLINKAGKEVSEDAVKKVLEAAGIAVDGAKVKSLLAALDGVDIGAVIKENATMAAAPVASGAAPAAQAPAQEAKKEEKKEEVDASEGLGALF